MNGRVQREATFDSDHYLKRIKVKPIPDNTNKKTPRIARQDQRTENQPRKNKEYNKHLDSLDSYEWDKMVQRI